jgi:hypothetical protein
MQTSEQTTHINNIPLAHGELSIVMSKSVDEAMHHSWELATECQRLGVGVMLINTGISKRRFTLADPRTHSTNPSARDAAPSKAQLMVHCSNRGDVIAEATAILQIVRDCKIGVVIISSWEWTSGTASRTKNLRYYLRALMEDEEVAVIVYSQSPTTPKAGCYDRGGTGRLAEMAIAVADLRGGRESVKTSPRPKPIVARTTSERDAMERTAQIARELVASNINDLGVHDSENAPLNILEAAGADPGLNLSVAPGSK